ncbi:MAG: hypothetical protein ACJ75B_05925 [Flavisolibacter sp.]
MKTLCCWGAMIFSCHLFAQGSSIITIKAGEDISSVYQQMYRFPQFIKGKVYFENGDSAGGRMNYNFVLAKMQFINAKNDTLELSEDTPIKQIVLERDSFAYASGNYLELLPGYHHLALRQRLEVLDEQDIGAYGIPTSTHTVDKVNSLKDMQEHRLNLNRDLVLKKEKQYFFLTSDNHYLLLNKKNLEKAFPKKSSAIRDYLEYYHTDLSNEKEVKMLMDFISKRK